LGATRCRAALEQSTRPAGALSAAGRADPHHRAVVAHVAGALQMVRAGGFEHRPAMPRRGGDAATAPTRPPLRQRAKRALQTRGVLDGGDPLRFIHRRHGLASGQRDRSVDHADDGQARVGPVDLRRIERGERVWRRVAPCTVRRAQSFDRLGQRELRSTLVLYEQATPDVATRVQTDQRVVDGISVDRHGLPLTAGARDHFPSAQQHSGSRLGKVALIAMRTQRGGAVQHRPAPDPSAGTRRARRRGDDRASTSARLTPTVRRVSGRGRSV